MADCGRAAVLKGPYGKPYEFKEHLIEDPGPAEALVYLQLSGVCHGDVYSRDGGGPAPVQPVRPLIGGHEGVGRIIKLHPDAKHVTGLELGQSVGIAWRSSVCGHCDACRAKLENFCERQEITGLSRDGTYQQYIKFPLEQLHPLPTGLDLTLACPLLCAGITAYSSLMLLNPQPGKWISIAGAAGALGHLAIQYAKVFGLKVAAIDGCGTEKEEFCREMGADVYIDFQEAGTSLVQTVKTLSQGGVDYALILSPHQSCYDDAGGYVSFGGQIVAIAVSDCHMPLRPLLEKAITVRSTQTGTKADMQAALRLGLEGKVRSRVEVLKLDELNLALDRIKAGKVLGKLVVDLR